MMENNIGREFMHMTKYQNLGIYPQKQGASMPPLELPLKENAEIIDLPAGKDLLLGENNLSDLIEKRVSLRKYSDDPLSIDELAFLLWGTQGVKFVTDRPATQRTVPSAGARHPFETYMLVNKVNGLKPGLYRYMALDHKLACFSGFENINQELTEACLKQQQVKNSAVTFAWVAVPGRTVWRYSQRAYRYIHLDAGHVCQNLYLLAEVIDCGVCAIAAYDDDMVNKVLGLDGEELFVIYLASLGKKVNA